MYHATGVVSLCKKGRKPEEYYRSFKQTIGMCVGLFGQAILCNEIQSFEQKKAAKFGYGNFPSDAFHIMIDYGIIFTKGSRSPVSKILVKGIPMMELLTKILRNTLSKS